MNDFKITLNKKQELFLSKLLPKGCIFELYKVRKNISDYPYRQLDKKIKPPQSIILSKKQSVIDSFEQSQQISKQKSQPPAKLQHFKKIQEDCYGLLKKLKKHESSMPFRAPVDAKALQVPDYYDIVLEPIDLKIIEENIRKDCYQHIAQFERDIYKIIMNSYKYNQKQTPVFNRTKKFEEYFLQVIKQFYNQLETAQEIKQQAQQQKQECKVLDNNTFIEKINSDIFKAISSIQMQKQKKDEIEMPKIKQQHKQKPKVKSRPRPPKVKKPKPQKIEIQSQSIHESIRQSIREEPQQPIRQQVQQTVRQAARQTPRYSKKTIPPEFLAIMKAQQEMYAKQQGNLLLSQQQRELFQDDLIKEQMFSNIQKQEDTIRQMGISQQQVSYSKISTTDVQKQISHILKRLNEFPLTKMKKNKLPTKINLLDINMSSGDKKKLYEKVFKLDNQDVEYIVEIVTKGKKSAFKGDEFQIDFDKTDNKVLREIQNFIAIRDNTNVFQNGIQAEILKPNKKVKKEEKKAVKKKVIRKNSNDDSFSINPPNPKKKKSIRNSKNSLFQKQQNNSNLQRSSNSYYPQNEIPRTVNRRQSHAPKQSRPQSNEFPPSYLNSYLQNQDNTIKDDDNIDQYFASHNHSNYSLQKLPSNKISNNNDDDDILNNHHFEQSNALSAGKISIMKVPSEKGLEMFMDDQFLLNRSKVFEDEEIREYESDINKHEDFEENEFFN